MTNPENEGWNVRMISCCAIDAARLRPLLLLSVAGIIVVCISLPGFVIPASGDLALISEPEGATAFVNGRLVGATPLVLNRLKLGHYSLRLEKEGFAPLQRSVRIEKEGLSLRETL